MAMIICRSLTHWYWICLKLHRLNTEIYNIQWSLYRMARTNLFHCITFLFSVLLKTVLCKLCTVEDCLLVQQIASKLNARCGWGITNYITTIRNQGNKKRCHKGELRRFITRISISITHLFKSSKAHHDNKLSSNKITSQP